MSLAILFHLCTQHVSDINMSIIRSLQLWYWTTTSVVLFPVRCVLEILCGWVWVVSMLQAASVHVAGYPSSGACRLLAACNTDTTQNQPHQISNTQRTEHKTTDVVIQQQSRKLLLMDILMSETCWVHKKWNKIANDIKLVFYSSNITMMHGPINIRYETLHPHKTAEFNSCVHFCVLKHITTNINYQCITH